jgi:molybdenum cofactor synthesis domain-containing protein
MIRVAILTISDSVSRGEREDRSGPKLRERVEALGWTVSVHEVIPDERDGISARLRELADADEARIILTTGGTGVALPEAARDVIEREIPGLGEVMRADGRLKTPLAALSRSVAGTRGRTLIVTLPGSPKGAVESLDAVAALLPHIVDLLEGRTEHVPH